VGFIDVSAHIFRVAAEPDKTPYSRGSLFRLLLPGLMDVPKVIYLDCDIIVNLDIAELWNAPLEAEGKSLAAVRQRLVWSRAAAPYMKIREWLAGYATEDYFNSGVLVMDLERIRRQYPDFVQAAFRFPDRFAARHSRFTEYLDQDFLNVFFQGVERRAKMNQKGGNRQGK
jgi:lipopolysaccharide biosynthesis glycosyltransferase